MGGIYYEERLTLCLTWMGIFSSGREDEKRSLQKSRHKTVGENRLYWVTLDNYCVKF